MNLIKILSLCMVFSINSCLSGEFDSIHSNVYNPKYVLPFPIGETYYVSQAFDGPYTHFNEFRYAVDFKMPIGTIITAAREGDVVFVRDSFPDDEYNPEYSNLVVIQHNDSTFSRYVHIMKEGALVKAGTHINVDDTIAYSGASGASGFPHLHFDVTENCYKQNCMTTPFYFKNINERDGIIKMNKYYTRNQ